MIIYGLTKTTLLDFPEHIACTVFTGGCNIRCIYCHNHELTLKNPLSVSDNNESDNSMSNEHSLSDPAYYISEEDFFSFLKKRTNILQGVCISGGEPTLSPDLISFIRQIKAMDFKVKLDTNGLKPQVLEDLLSENLLDMVSMDIKGSLEKYPYICGINFTNSEINTVTYQKCSNKTFSNAKNSTLKYTKHFENSFENNIKKSIALLINSSIVYEFRTTVFADMLSDSDAHQIGQMLCGAQKYYLQYFKESEQVPDKKLKVPTQAEMEHLQVILKNYVPQTFIRG